jgi:uncharacterized DUF497 family protein
VRYDWDAENVSHLALHKITPREAEEVLEDAPILVQIQHHAAEDRFLVLGHTKSGRLLALVYTERDDKVRVVPDIA